MQDVRSRMGNKPLSTHLTTQCIRRAEREFKQADFDNNIVKPITEAGWSLDFIYLDKNTHRFEVQK
jgi:hypothetical protein